MRKYEHSPLDDQIEFDFCCMCGEGAADAVYMHRPAHLSCVAIYEQELNTIADLELQAQIKIWRSGVDPIADIEEWRRRH